MFLVARLGHGWSYDEQQKTALETSSLCSLSLQLAPICIHVKKWQTITWLCVRLPIYASVGKFAHLCVLPGKGMLLCFVFLW